MKVFSFNLKFLKVTNALQVVEHTRTNNNVHTIYKLQGVMKNIWDETLMKDGIMTSTTRSRKQQSF